jgi:hypothetical protein
MTEWDRLKLHNAMEAARNRLRSMREAVPWVPDMLGPQLAANCRKFAASGQLFGNSEQFDSPALRDAGNGV